MQIVHRYGDVIAEKYQIIDILGQGGSCTTYAVQDLTSNQKIALKSLSLHWVKDWKVVELFEREGNILSQLDHPAIPRYLEYFYIDTLDNRSFYIAQQVAPGKSLAFRVEQGWRTTEQEVKDIAIQVLEVLKYLHGLTPPVVHRDIKPQNIIRGDDGKVFLVDFGAVQQTYHNTFMRGSTVVGTYGYMAPEQFRSQAVPATDLYGLAATLLYLLTHRSPADLPSDGLKIDVCSCVKVSEHFTAWLEKMLEPDLEQRFGSATEALEALLHKHPIKSNKIVKKPKTTLKLLLATASVIAAVYSINLLSNYRLEVLTKLGFSNFINTISLNQGIGSICWGK
jgi:serine/threonine protein kinase